MVFASELFIVTLCNKSNYFICYLVVHVSMCKIINKKKITGQSKYIICFSNKPRISMVTNLVVFVT